MHTVFYELNYILCNVALVINISDVLQYYRREWICVINEGNNPYFSVTNKIDSLLNKSKENKK